MTGDNKDCPRCCVATGEVTFENQACMPINGRVQCIDWCIHQIVAALNAGGIETVASCCGHSVDPGRIDLADGRVLTVTSYREWCRTTVRADQED